MLPVDALGFRRGAGALKTLLSRPGAGGSSAVRPGQGPRHPGAVRAHRVDRRHQRRQRRPVGRGHRVGGGEGRVLGRRRRPDGHAEDHRLRGRVRHDRGSRPGAQDPGDRAPGRQAAADLPVRQQRRHRRFADRRRRAQEVRRATAWSTSGPRTAGTSSRCRTGTTTTRSWACSRRWRTGIRRIGGR